MNLIHSPGRAATEGSQSSLHQWGAVTLFHGLPSDHVRAIAQDGEGTLWFATDGGLAKYDGRRVLKITDDALPSGPVRALKVDAGGSLWIGEDAGAVLLANNHFTRISATAGHTITAIITPGAGRALMASADGCVFDCRVRPEGAADGTMMVRAITPRDSGLLSVDAGGRVPLELTSLALVAEAPVGEAIIVGTHSRGLLRVELPENDRATVAEVPSRPRAFFVEAIETDARNQVWLGAQTTPEDSGLYRGLLRSGDLGHPEKIGAALGTVTAMTFDARGDLWAGTDSQGVSRFRDGRRVEHFTFEGTAGGLRSNRVYALFIDREGVIWFGTDRGVCRYDPNGMRIETISESAESNFARALFRATDGTLWCGTNRGLFRRSSDGWQPAEAIGNRIVHAIGEDKKGRLLVGTASGLFIDSAVQGRSPPNRRTPTDGSKPPGQTAAPVSTLASFDEVADSVRAIQRFRGAVYIASFGRGVERLESGNRTTVWPPESSDAGLRQVVSLYAEGERWLWIGTADAGVFVFDGANVKAAEGLEELRGAAVWSISGSSDLLVWLGTARGLFAWHSGKLDHLIEAADVRSVVVTAPNLAWCATAGSGLYRVLVDPSGIISTKRDVEQGLPSAQVFTLFVAPDNSTVWMGTNRGIARYEPGSIAPLLSPARVMGKRLYGVDEVRAGLSLEYPQNSLAIDVAAASSRSFPEQFQYAFSVIDGAGHIIRQKLSRDSQIVLEGLSAGRYHVDARAFSSDLVASEPLGFDFTVARAPFPWTSTALSVLLLLALVAVWWGYRQNRNIARANVALESANLQLAETRLQLANETEAERRRISRDLHDQTLADLRRLMMMSDQFPANGRRAVEPAEFRQEIENISTEIRRICEDLSPSALANVGLGAALEWALANGVAQLPDDRKFEYEFVREDGLDDKLHYKPATQIQIFRIIQEAVNNVCRHSGATHVRLSVRTDADGALWIELQDNGCGFDPDQIHRQTGHGLTNIRSRASLIEAAVSWQQQEEGGMVFTLRKEPNRDTLLEPKVI